MAEKINLQETWIEAQRYRDGKSCSITLEGRINRAVDLGEKLIQASTVRAIDVGNLGGSGLVCFQVQGDAPDIFYVTLRSNAKPTSGGHPYDDFQKLITRREL